MALSLPDPGQHPWAAELNAALTQLDQQTVVDGTIVGDDLVLTRNDGSAVNTGNVRGPQGAPGGSDAAFAGWVSDDESQTRDALRRTVSSNGGLYLPTPYAGLRWRATLSEVRSGKRQGHIGVVGDSIASTGAPMSNPKYEYNWPGHLRAMLDKEFGPAGTGLVILDWDIRATPAYDDRFVYSGSMINAPYGFFQHGSVQLDAGSYLEFEATASEFWVLNLSSASGANAASIDGSSVGTFRNIADGGPAVTFERTAGTHINQLLTRIPASGVGEHTLRIAPPAGTFATMVAVEGRIPTSGTIRVSTAAISGTSLYALFSAAGTNDEAGGYYGLPMIDVLDADLLVIALGVNDWNMRRSIADFKADLGTLIQRQAAQGVNAGGGSNAAGDSMLVWYPRPDVAVLPGGTTPGPTWDEYREALYEVADTYNVPLLDLAERWKDFDTADSMGLFGDGIHPSNAGEMDLAPAIRRAILDVM